MSINVNEVGHSLDMSNEEGMLEGALVTKLGLEDA